MIKSRWGGSKINPSIQTKLKKVLGFSSRGSVTIDVCRRASLLIKWRGDAFVASLTAAEMGRPARAFLPATWPRPILLVSHNYRLKSTPIHQNTHPYLIYRQCLAWFRSRVAASLLRQGSTAIRHPPSIDRRRRKRASNRAAARSKQTKRPAPQHMSATAAAAPTAPEPPEAAESAALNSPGKKRARLTPAPAPVEQPTTIMAATLLRPPSNTATTAPAATAAHAARIHLTPHEEQLFGLLRGAAAAAGKGTVLRVAGGWVRDKLLGRCVRSVSVYVCIIVGGGCVYVESVICWTPPPLPKNKNSHPSTHPHTTPLFFPKTTHTPTGGAQGERRRGRGAGQRLGPSVRRGPERAPAGPGLGDAFRRGHPGWVLGSEEEGRSAPITVIHPPIG